MVDSLVSIIIPVFNRAHLISQTLDAVLHQSYRHWECIVVDDDSQDKTTSIVRSYCEKDDRFKLKNRPKELEKGGNICRNFGFKLSKGDYIQWLDSDDLIAENKIAQQVAALEKNREASVAICKYGYFTDSKDLMVRAQVETYKSYSNGEDLLKAFGKYTEYFPPHVFLTKRDVIDKAGLWNEGLEINQDGEFFTRVLLAAQSVKFVNVNAYYRKSDNDNVSLVSSAERAQSLIHSWELIQEYLYKHTGKKEHIYVKSAKRVIYDKLKADFPEVIAENRGFFSQNHIPTFNRIFNIFRSV